MNQLQDLNLFQVISYNKQNNNKLNQLLLLIWIIRKVKIWNNLQLYHLILLNPLWYHLRLIQKIRKSIIIKLIKRLNNNKSYHNNFKLIHYLQNRSYHKTNLFHHNNQFLQLIYNQCSHKLYYQTILNNRTCINKWKIIYRMKDCRLKHKYEHYKIN